MAVTATGVYLAFDGGPDRSRADDAGIGPYDEIVLRGARAVGERAGLGKVIALRSSAGSWRDADSSSSGSDQTSGTRHGNLRISAGNAGILVRFSDDEVAGQVPVPDLGPFAQVLVGTHEVRGDEETLAVRVSRISPWQMTDKAGPEFQGAIREALVFVASGHSFGNRPRQAVVTGEPPPSRAESPKADVPKPANAPAPVDDEAGPSVWVDRVRTAPKIYISRPDPKR
ncbi:MAG TPA: hypothetical protein VEN31_05945 [Candidatus Bathyarchaeia archaeon]|nr:hypothetical protein [Candidatus Bathyarchaeia archaeon]